MSKSKKLFRWDEILGEDKEKFIEYLREYFGIDWVKIAQIKKIDDIRAIRAFTENKYLFLRLNDEKTKAILTIDDGRTEELAVKSENGELIIYSESIIIKNLTSFFAIYLYIVSIIYYTVGNIEIFLGTAIPEILRKLIILITILVIIIYIIYRIYGHFNDIKVQIKDLLKYLNKILNKPPEVHTERPKVPPIVEENLGYKDVEFAIYYLTEKIDNANFLVPKEVFDWNEIPGKGEENLRKFLMYMAPSLKDVEVPWIRNAKIDKINNKEIRISYGDDSCSIKLDDKKPKAVLTGPEQHGFRKYEFLAEKNNGKHTISQKYDPVQNIIIGVDRGGAIIGGMLAKNLGLAVKTLATAYASEHRRDPGIDTSIRCGKCLENIDFELVKRILLVDDAIRGGGSIKAAKDMLDEKLYFFCWDKIPRNDKEDDKENERGRLKKFLTLKFDIDWVNTAKIEKIDYDKTIRVSTKRKSLELRLNDDETKVNIDIDGKNHEFVVKKVINKRNICKEKSFSDIEVKIACILNQVGGRRRPLDPDFWIYAAERTDILLPWDKMHWFEELVLEKDEIKLFEEVYEESQKKPNLPK